MNRACLFVFVLAATVAATGHAQSTPLAAPAPAPSAASDVPQPPLCDPALIDGTFSFASLPAGEQTVSLHLRNTSGASCRLQGRAASSFAVDGHSMRPKIGICWLCDQNNQPSPTPQRQPANEILLAPGGVATLDLYWSSTGPSCQYADWVVFNVQWAKSTGYLFTPSEWPLHVCSDVRSTGYRAGPDSPATGAVQDGMLRVSVPPNTFYSDEQVKLHVELPQPHPAGLTVGCAALYTVRQGPENGTRLDPLPVSGSRRIESFTGEQVQEDEERAWPSWKRDRLRTCDIEAGKTTADAQISAADLASVTHIEWRPWRTIAVPVEEPAFQIADTHFTVLDPDTLDPNWGDTVQGIRVGLSIDRATFSTGEMVPLHLRWENVNATQALGQGECGEPEPSLEIQDSQHKVLQTVPVFPECMGHGWGPFAIAPGKPQRVYRQLGTEFGSTPTYVQPEGVRLPGPGAYYLVSVWSPRVLEHIDNLVEPGDIPLGPGRYSIGTAYATARSLPVRVEIVGRNNP